MKEQGCCPLCERQYNKKNRKTHHHVFPKQWYGAGGVQVEVCQKCHQIEFNHLYPMNYKWSKEECLQNWSDFCKSKGKWMLKVYPELKKEFMGRI
jgi:hypothetical protein